MWGLLRFFVATSDCDDINIPVSGRQIGLSLRMVDQPIGVDTRVHPFPDEIHTHNLAEVTGKAPKM